MMAVAIIGVIAAIAIPQYSKYIKRSRTAEGIDHVNMLYFALADWYSNPNLGNGSFVSTTSDFDNIAGGSKTFAEHFPAEASWIDVGDKSYVYSMKTTLASDGGKVPMVTATAINTDAVFGIIIKTKTGGESTVTAISSTY